MADLLKLSVFSIATFLILTTTLAEIRVTHIRSDDRSAVPFDEFRFTHNRRLDLNISYISLKPYRQPQARSISSRILPLLSRCLGFYKHPPSSSYSSNSSEFLYLGTIYNSRDVIQHKDLLSAFTSVSVQRRVGGSPELHPLPPLPRHNFRNYSYRNQDDEHESEEDEFFSPRGSSGRHLEVENFGNQNMDFVTTTSRCSNSCSPSLTDSSLQLENSSSPFV